MRPIETTRPRAAKALHGLILGLPISMALWVGIGVMAATAIS
ncbi:hypothetical protein [Sphingomonas montanisoli]|nr:hypothetical protein [Sphingomonas montanisoli]